MPSLSTTPGRNCSSTTSARSASFKNMSRPSGCLRSMAIDFLLRLTWRKAALWLAIRGGLQRVGSPVRGSSTLITSAPRSPSIIEAKGPGSMRERSSTRIPSNACRIGAPLTRQKAKGKRQKAKVRNIWSPVFVSRGSAKIAPMRRVRFIFASCLLPFTFCLLYRLRR